MKVFLSGCCGYIGSRLVQYLLEAGYQVTGLDSQIWPGTSTSLLSHMDNSLLTFIKGDVRDKDLVGQLVSENDVILPLAAIVGAPACERRPEWAWTVNYESLKYVASIAKNKRIISFNTNSGYGRTDGMKHCTEEDPLNPISVYGKSKVEGEKAILDCPNSVVFRLATVFGLSPRMRFDLLLNDFTYRLSRLRWQPAYTPVPRLEIFEGHFLRNFVGIKDVCKAVMFAIGERRLKGVYNLGNPDANLSKLALAHKVCDRLGLSHEAVIEGDGFDSDKRNYLVSNEKILSEGFRFTHSLENGIDEVSRISRLLSPEQVSEMRNR